MLQDYLKAGYPALCCLTQEPHRAEALLPCEGWRFLSWNCIEGIKDFSTQKIVDETRDPVGAVNYLGGFQDTVLITHNLHLFLEMPEVIQSIQNGIPRWKATGCALVMVSPVIQMRPEVEKFFHVVDLPLPDDEELFTLQLDMGKTLNVKPNRKAARAAKGLTEFEAETAYALSLTRKGYFSTRVISEAKGQMIRKSGLMEFWEPASIQDVGGLGNLKKYIETRAKALSPDNPHLPQLKGILLVGIPGTGKSLASKATASILNYPLIRLDIGSLKNSLVGQSELRMRQATKLIDAFGKATIWLDEVEKMFAGTRSSGETDAGTTASMFATFLTWMAETKSSVLVMATANTISQLPPEFMRAQIRRRVLHRPPHQGREDRDHHHHEQEMECRHSIVLCRETEWLYRRRDRAARKRLALRRPRYGIQRPRSLIENDERRNPVLEGLGKDPREVCEHPGRRA